MKRLTAVAVSFALAGALASTAATAVPTVSGNTISWPDDGWYQVLNADDFTEICQGGSSCMLSAGRYIVINHTTGQRFENVVVRDNSGAVMPVTVSGSTISWPDDGWYQVQRADDYSSVCEGVRQCDVDDGVYTVINHTLGLRYAGILVDASNSGPENPIDPVEPGTPVIGGEIVAGQIPAPVDARLDEATPYLLESLAGYQLENAQTYVATLGEEIVSTAISQTVLDSTMIPIAINGYEDEAVNERIEYACSGGGSMLRETAVLVISESDYSQDNAAERWSFADCLVDTTAGDLLSGEHVINGDMSFVNESRSGSRFTSYEQVVTYSNFTLAAPGDNSLTIDGNASVSVVNTDSPYSNRNVLINEYQEVRDGSILRDIRDGDFLFSTGTQGSGVVQDTIFSANGRILGSVTQGMDVTIRTDENFAQSAVINEVFEQFRVPLSGQMQLSSTDGSEMSISGNSNAPDYNAPLRYDYKLLTVEGENVNGESQPMPTFVVTAPEAMFYQR